MLPPMSQKSTSAASIYQQRLQKSQACERRFQRWSYFLSQIRLLTFLGFAGLALLVWTNQVAASAIWGSLGFLLAFLASAVAHNRTLRRAKFFHFQAEVNERGLARLDNRWNGFLHKGEQFLDSQHPYLRDLNIFGEHSLFQMIDTTSTKLGEGQLAHWLRFPATTKEIHARQQAVGELASEIDFRQRLEIEGKMLSNGKADPTPILSWAKESFFTLSGVWKSVVWILPLATVALFTLSKWIPSIFWITTLMLQVVVALRFGQKAFAIRKKMSPGEKLFHYEHLFAVLESWTPFSPWLKNCQTKLHAGGASPSKEMKKLARALDFLQVADQPLLHIPLAILTLWDVHWILALQKWKESCGSQLNEWFSALGQIEALSSLAGISFEHPEYCLPEVKEGTTHFCAQHLAHPLLCSQGRVANDVNLGQPGSVLLISGSNMSGKTTLLRTIGINGVLALAGAPVCAHSLQISPLQICTSMRIQDSLAEGLSLFYAELLRLKQVVDLCHGGPCLFLLDEILHGTNTAERQKASHAILQKLVHTGSIGAVATHDLGLARLETDTQGLVRNVHFSDHLVDGEMAFDYQMRPGVVTSTNALALLKKIGIEIS